MQAKIKFVLGFFILVFVSLIARLAYWQIIRGSELAGDAQNQYTSSKVTTAPRGNILASDGSFWVIRKDAWLVFANTNETVDYPKNIANKLAPFFTEDPSDRFALLTEVLRIETLLGKKGAWIPIKQKVEQDIKKNIEALKIKGIGFEPQEIRFYPEASSAAQLTGFVGKDEAGTDVGYFGLEGYYNLALSGKAGFVGREKDARGAPILLGDSREVSARPGVDLVTNIDKRIELLTEEKLKEGLEKYGARSGSAVVMDPRDGRVLSITAIPSYDPAKYWEYGDEFFKNPVISDSFEPGSIFKVLVMASALDAGAVEPDTKCDACAGPLKVDKYFIKTWNNEYNDGITMTDTIIHSDNTGMAFAGQKLGADAMYNYLDKFGIGRLTGIDLQGEAAPRMRERGTWNIVDLATTSFGQGIAVTGIEMARAVSAIANGGYLVTPRVVERIQGEGWSEDVRVEPPKRIISKKAAKEITEMMEAAADKGEAKWTNTRGFKVAGKTGTAQIPVAGHYDTENTNHSFIGFAPADKPEFLMLVTLQSPQSSPWASETAAPLWYTIAKDLFVYFGIEPEN